MIRALDHTTLAIVLAAGLHLGSVGLFGLDLLELTIGGHAWIVQTIAGLAALWQATRQKFR